MPQTTPIAPPVEPATEPLPQPQPRRPVTPDPEKRPDPINSSGMRTNSAEPRRSVQPLTKCSEPLSVAHSIRSWSIAWIVFHAPQEADLRCCRNSLTNKSAWSQSANKSTSTEQWVSSWQPCFLRLPNSSVGLSSRGSKTDSQPQEPTESSWQTAKRKASRSNRQDESRRLERG